VTGVWSILRAASITVPLWQLLALLAALTVCTLFRCRKTAVVALYLAAYGWGWPFFHALSLELATVYTVFGCLTCLLGIVGMMRQEARGKGAGRRDAPPRHEEP
jgi:hypothetical protein